MSSILTITIICKDEISVMERLLNNLNKLNNIQVVILDTGSTDGTVEAIKEFSKNSANIKLAEYKWNDSFADARNAALALVDTEYSMWLDCDDIIYDDTIEFLNNIHSYIYQNKADLYRMYYKLGPNSGMYRERIFKTDKFKWVGDIHEVLDELNGANYTEVTISEKYFIHHSKIKVNEPGRNLRIFEQMIAKGKPFNEREKVYYAKELYYNGLPEAYDKLKDCVYNGNSWFGDKLACCEILYKLEKDQDKKIDICMKAITLGPSPRPDFLCYIGDYFYLVKKNLSQAEAWYRYAYESNYLKQSTQEIITDNKYYTWYPLIQLSVVCWYIDREKANEYYRISKELYPDNKYVKMNSKYFN